MSVALFIRIRATVRSREAKTWHGAVPPVSDDSSDYLGGIDFIRCTFVRFGGGPRLVTAAAATPCAILIVTDTALSRVAEQCPEIWRAVARLLYEQLRYALRFGADVLTLPPTQMVAARPKRIVGARLSH
jgi:CRP-like cAMP-binding protein